MVRKVRIDIRPYPRRLRFIRDRFDRVRRGGWRRRWALWNRVGLRSQVRLGIWLNTHKERINNDHKCKRCASDPLKGSMPIIPGKLAIDLHRLFISRIGFEERGYVFYPI